jgi:quercetin dioxygenase-like cupin family protein
VYSEFDISGATCHYRCTPLFGERRDLMYTISIDALEAQEMGGGLSVTFPFSSATGTADTAAVYLVFEPGGVLPEHTDSAEEWLLVLEGTVEATVGDETGVLEAGQLALVPVLAPHGARNVGDGPARVLGFFGASTNIGQFTEELAPGVKTLVVGAAPGVALPVPAPEPALA